MTVATSQRKMTPKQFLKLNPQKYVMVTYEFGTPIFISEPTTNGMFDIGVSDKKDEAIEWNEMDNTPNKLSWYNTKSGYKGLIFEKI